MSSDALKPGTSLQRGKYCIVKVLGQGGFGITYLAQQVSLARVVAVKVFFLQDCCERDTVAGQVKALTIDKGKQIDRYRNKFLKEAQVMALLSHPHIMSVIDVWEENGTGYYSMPYLSCGSLKDLIQRQGKLNEDTALRYTRQLADALRYLHGKRLCHYDVEPANIMLDENGLAVLADFGLTKHYEVRGRETSHTPVGLSEGFAPIEQYEHLINEFLPSSDVYALGATLYYMLTGKVAPSAISRVQNNTLTFNSAISHTTRSLIESAMTVTRKECPQNLGIFLQTLPSESPTLNGRPALAKVVSGDKTRVDFPESDEPQAIKKHTTRNTVLAVVLCMLVGCGIFWFTRNDNQSAVDEEERVAPVVDAYTDWLWMFHIPLIATNNNKI